MSFWSVSHRDETQEVDYGSMHLNETPSLYHVPNLSTRPTIQSLSVSWLEGGYGSNVLKLADYQRRIQELRRAVRLGIDSATTCTDNIIYTLKQLKHNGWLNNRWHLISVDCDHFASEPWERGFACCYRNAQCILSALFRLPQFKKRLFGSFSAMPSLWKLQALLESAWSLGFDPLGASQIAASINSNHVTNSNCRNTSPSTDDDCHQHQLVGLVDSTAWLGATDLASLFGSIGIRSSIIECRAPSGPGGTHPFLLAHIHSYITGGRNTDSSSDYFTVPLLLQHEGHSRIVIGVETDEHDRPVALIVLEPSTSIESMCQLTKAADHSVSGLDMDTISTSNWMNVLGSMRLDITQLVEPQYQLLQVNGLIETELDLQDAMMPENITITIS